MRPYDFDAGPTRVHSLPRVPRRGDNSEPARQERLEHLRQATGASLDSIARTRLRDDQLTSNLEAFIGSVEVPLAVGGPLYFNGEYAQGVLYAPLATSEGALVSSVTRGAYAISLCGGVTTRVLGRRMLRAPMFVMASQDAALALGQLALSRLAALREIVARYSNHAQLLELQVHPMGRAVSLLFAYETGNAAGQNMTTTCTWHACLWLIEQARAHGLDASDFVIDGGLSSDKKVSAANLMNGRGMRVQAEACISKSVLRRVLKVDARQVQRMWNYSLTMAVSAGLTGLNTNVANVVAAFFAATGQDLASVHESSVAVMAVDAQADGDLHLALTMPSLVIGTVGGGTHLPDQRDGLEMLACRGPGSVKKLGEIIAGYALALDLSTMSAIVAGHFAIAHEKMGRNNHESHFKLGELTPEFFRATAPPGGVLASIEHAEPLRGVAVEDSVISETSARRLKRPVGLFPFRVKSREAGVQDLDVMVKIKATSNEIADIAGAIAQLCSAELGEQFKACKDLLPSHGCDVRELAIFAHQDERFVRHAPRFHGAYRNDKRNAYVLVQELLTDVELLNSVNQLHLWRGEHIEAALDGAAQLHAVWLGREAELRAQPWLGHPPSRATAERKQALYRSLLQYASQELPELFGSDTIARFSRYIDEAPKDWEQLQALPRALVHQDFNPRNMAFRRAPAGLRLCVYDWELANLHVPQRDCAELLAYVLPADCSEETLLHWVERHRLLLQAAAGTPLPSEAWLKGHELALRDFALSTVLIYAMLHSFRNLPYLPGLLEGVVHQLSLLERLVGLATARHPGVLCLEGAL